MHNVVAAFIVSAWLVTASLPQTPQIPIADAIEAIRYFRSLALDSKERIESLNFCQIADAFDRDGNLRRNRQSDEIPYATRAECERGRATGRVADGVYFEWVKPRGSTLVFRARRKYGEALSTQEYVVERVGRTAYLRVKFAILLASTS